MFVDKIVIWFVIIIFATRIVPAVRAPGSRSFKILTGLITVALKMRHEMG